MSQLQSYDDNIIDISDSDNEQAVAGPLQVQTRPFVAGSKRPNVPRQAPVVTLETVSDTVKPTALVNLGSIHSGSTLVPRISSNHGTPVARKPLIKVVDPIDLTFSSEEDETATTLPSTSACSTHPPDPELPRPLPHFIQPGTPSPPSATTPVPTQKSSPTHNRRVPPAASPGLGDILVPGRKKRKRRFDGYQPGLIGFDDHDDGTSGPADPNSDLPTKKRARHSIGGAKPIPATAKNKGIRGLVFARKAKHNVIGKEAPCTGLKLSEKENKAKGLRKNKVAPGKLSIFYLKEPEKHDTVIPRTDIDDIFRTVTSDNNADEATMDTDVDMGANPHTHTHGRFPTPIQHAQTPRPPSLAKEGSVASHGPSQRAETTQEVIDVLDYELNLFWDEGEDADLQRPLQLNCEVHSSSTHPTVCAPSVIEVDDTIDFGPIPSTSTGVPYSDTAGASGSWQFHDLAPNPEVPFIRDDLYEPSLNVSGVCETNKKSEERIPDPFASHVVDLHRQTIQEQLRVWADNPQADISFDLANELVVVRENLAVRVAKQRFADDISGVSRPHEKGDIERFIELNLKAIPSEPEGISDERDVIPESPEVERQSTPEERAAVMSLSGVSGSGSSRLSTTPGALSIINLDIKARNEGAAAAPLFAAKPKLQEPTLPSKSAPSGTYLSTTESKSAHQEPAAPLKRVGATSRTTRTQSSRKVTEPALEDLNNIMLKRLNLTLDALAQRKRPTWDPLAPFRLKALRLRAEELMQLQLEQEPAPDRVEDDEP